MPAEPMRKCDVLKLIPNAHDEQNVRNGAFFMCKACSSCPFVQISSLVCAEHRTPTAEMAMHCEAGIGVDDG